MNEQLNKKMHGKKSKIFSLHSKRAQDEKSKIFILHSKRAQDEKSKIFILHSKRAQEEMVGFAIIMIVVAVILLIFLGFKLSSHKVMEIKSYEVDSFISSTLQYTSNCSSYLGKLSVSGLISKCKNNQQCLDNRNSCDVLNKTLSEITYESWEKGNPLVKGYELNMSSEDEGEIMSLKRGNKTSTFKGSTPVAVSGVDIEFKVYY